MLTPIEIMSQKQVDLTQNIQDAIADISQHLEDSFQGDPVTMDFKQVDGFDPEHWPNILKGIKAELFKFDWSVTLRRSRDESQLDLIITPGPKYWTSQLQHNQKPVTLAKFLT